MFHSTVLDVQPKGGSKCTLIVARKIHHQCDTRRRSDRRRRRSNNKKHYTSRKPPHSAHTIILGSLLGPPVQAAAARKQLRSVTHFPLECINNAPERLPGGFWPGENDDRYQPPTAIAVHVTPCVCLCLGTHTHMAAFWDTNNDTASPLGWDAV